MEKKELTLLVMAAGMGSRFGGLKQIEPMGPNGEFLIDYSVYDAIKAGFKKIVFIIKEENYDLFKETIGKRVEDKINTSYVFQDMMSLPEGCTVVEDREKPWGTAHAIWCARNDISGPFAIVNADDFYGYDAYRVMANFLDSKSDNEYSLVGYKVENTLTENGAVKRGVCEVENGYLTSLIESNVRKENGEIIAMPLDGRDAFVIKEDTLVSMNMLGFDPSIFKYINDTFKKFQDKNKDNLLKCEYLIPDVLERATLEGVSKTRVLSTTAVWEGVTYKEDKEPVQERIKNRIENGEYPSNLWK